jgi:uncharacterized Zn finger protein
MTEGKSLVRCHTCNEESPRPMGTPADETFRVLISRPDRQFELYLCNSCVGDILMAVGRVF